MAVLIPQVLERMGLRADRVAQRAGLSARAYYARAEGHAAWGVDEVQACVDALHVIGRELRAIRVRDVVEPGTVLRPAGRKFLRTKKDAGPTA